MTTAIRKDDSASAATVETSHEPDASVGTLADQLRVTLALLVAGVIFWTVGWVVMQPIDPHGPVTILAVQKPISTLATLAGLAVVAAGMGTLIAGRHHPTMGAIAAAIGLAALNLRGAESDKIGGYVPLSAPPGWPTMSLVFELWLWLAIIGLGYFVGTWCHAWMFSPPASHAAPAGSRGKAVARSDAAFAPVIPAVVLTALAAYLVLPYLCGPPRDEVLKFQMYFAVGASLMIGAALAQAFFKPAIAWWPLLAVGIVGTAAYLVAGPTIRDAAAPYLPLRFLPGVPARPLPIELASFGVIGGLIGITAPGWFVAFEKQATNP